MTNLSIAFSKSSAKLRVKKTPLHQGSCVIYGDI